jgi:UDP-glucuronate 4-epimerase
MKKILVTGSAGFIGYHVVKKLIGQNVTVVGLDIINDYYDVNLKYGRLADQGIEVNNITYNVELKSRTYPGLHFIKLDLTDEKNISALFKNYQFDTVINLAAQAGVRYSLTNPKAYLSSNIEGFLNILEACRHNQVKHLVYASSSSVYGLNENMPFSVHHNVDHPISLYAACKKSNELMAHTYSYLYQLPTTGLRFFTVYGPWGRPDMALFIFTKAIMAGNPIEIYNNGNMQRDFTYIDDIVEGVIRVAAKIPAGNPNWSGKNPDPGCSKAPYRLYNIGNHSPVKLLDFIEAIENKLGKKAKRNYLPIQPGDVPSTFADVTDLIKDINYTPSTSLQQGIDRFIAWYKEFYK